MPRFTLTDQEGRAFDSVSLGGKAWVANFIFTRCADTCPRMTARLLLVEDGVQRIPGLRERVRLVSFSVDPERDRPADLKNYAERFGADTGLWTFLTGERGEVARLCQEGFLLPVAAADRRAAPEPSPEIVHSDRFILVDPEGRIRGYYQPLGEAGELERLLADLERLAGERSAPAR